jgi:hypothetical protein
MATTVRIARRIALVQPYARNGNVGERKPRCTWTVEADGRIVSSPYYTLKAALELARDFDPKADKTCVYDPTPIPEKV